MSCGDCVACCFVFRIDEIEKPKLKKCEYCTGKSCGIYEERPEECRSFKCLYLQYAENGKPWPESDRPDNSGVIIHKSETGAIEAVRFKTVDPNIMKRIKMVQEDLKTNVNGVTAK